MKLILSLLLIGAAGFADTSGNWQASGKWKHCDGSEEKVAVSIFVTQSESALHFTKFDYKFPHGEFWYPEGDIEIRNGDLVSNGTKIGTIGPHDFQFVGLTTDSKTYVHYELDKISEKLAHHVAYVLGHECNRLDLILKTP